MIKRTLMLMLVALVAMFANLRAAQLPVCQPDEYDDLMAMMDNMTSDEKLDMLIEMINADVKEDGSNHRIYKDAAHNAVVMQMDGDELGVPASFLMSPEVQSSLKPMFLSSVLEDDDDDGYNEEFALLLLLVANTDQNLEIKLVNGNDMANAATWRYTPDEIYDAIGSALGVYDQDGEDEEDDLGIDEDVDVDALLKEVVDQMEEYFQSNPEIDGHIWLDEQANRVVMSTTNDELDDVGEIRDYAYLFKPLFLKTMMETDVEANSLLFAIIASSGRGLQVQLYGPSDKSNPIVLDFTADELMEVIDSYEE